MKINYGCGKNKLEGFVNIDIEATCNPDVVCDARFEPLPYSDVELIVAFHVIEHVEYAHQGKVLDQFARVLKSGGRLVLSYPDFEKCSYNFLTNHRGLKDFWRATLYGRQLYPGDYHVTPMVTNDLVEMLKTLGFVNFNVRPEVNEDYNTVVECVKAEKPFDYSEALKETIFGEFSPTNGRFRNLSNDKSTA